MVTSGHEVPEGIRADARENWPPRELIESFLGEDYLGFQFRPGEEAAIPADDPEALAAARRFRDVMSLFATGVAVITTVSNGEPVGMTCQSFSSVSLDPPLVLFCPMKTSRAWPRIQRSGKFCVNFLAAHQSDVSNTMASRGADKFASIAWSPAPATGSPLLDEVLGYVDCTIHAVHEAGDHYIVIGRVQDLGGASLDHGLTFYRGRYGSTEE